jgi:hypothetical protein
VDLDEGLDKAGGVGALVSAITSLVGTAGLESVDERLGEERLGRCHDVPFDFRRGHVHWYPPRRCL